MEREKGPSSIESDLERIVGPAIIYKGTLYQGVIGNTHQQLFDQIRAGGGSPSRYDAEEGYVTSTGRFVDRTEGSRIAAAAPTQLKDHVRGVNWLISEDLKKG